MAISPLNSTESTLVHRYEEMYQHVASLTDTLGCGIDAGIFDTVVYLNLLNVTTRQSCEGHLDHGTPYPWITVIDQETEDMYNRGWIEVCELEDRAKVAGTLEAYDHYLASDVQLRLLVAQCEQKSTFYRHLIDLLDTFYQHSAAPDPPRLLIKRFKSAATYRIEPGYAEESANLPDHLKALYLERGQEEMQRFTTFLADLFRNQAIGL